jgi:hypothetical protein
MFKESEEAARRGAREAIAIWKARGCEFASIVDGLPTPWGEQPIKLIMADARRRRLEVLSLADPSHVELLVAAIFASIKRKLLRSAN